MFPQETSRISRASLLQLIYQGLFLHWASFWGPLRTSKAHRQADRHWLSHALLRWAQEYGGNFALVLMMQLLIMSTGALRASWLLTSLGSLLVPPLLSVLQMFLDNYRKDSRVFFDRESATGMTVKVYYDANGNLVWSYFNHFALPIGAKNGRTIRSEIHAQAKLKKAVVTCSAQNEIIADFYLQDMPSGENLGGRRPFMVWNYSGRPWAERKGNFLQTIFGVYSTRNSGQIPLGGRGKVSMAFC